MPTKSLDHIVICDTEDTELAEMLGDWLDTNLKTVTVVSYDSTEHLQFPVQTAQALKKAKSVVLCLTDSFMPLRFPLPQFQSCIADDPECSNGKVFAVAMRPLTDTEVVPMISIIDCYSGELSQNRRRFIERAIAATAPAKKRTRKSPPQAGTIINQNVGEARDVFAVGGNMNYTAKHVTKNEFTPDERHITSEQATKIKALIDELVDMDASAGKDKGKSYGMWWKMFNSEFKIATYRELPREFFDEAVLFLRQAKARNLPKIRRKDNELWRRKHYGTIFGIAKKGMGWTEDEVHQFASTKLKKRINSLTDIGEQDLARLARWIRAEFKRSKSA